MRTVLLLVVVGCPAFSAPAIDGPKLARLLGVSARARPPPPEVPSTLPARLLGTLRAGEERSLAAVAWEGRSVTVAIGDRLGDAELVSIEQRALLFLRGGRLERVGAEPGAPSSSPQRAGTQTIPRGTLEWALAHPQELLGSAHLIPAFSGGRALGFKVLGVRAGSLAGQLGLEVGDVVTAVNGTSLDSPQAVLGLLPALTTARRVEVELERGGRALVKTFVLER